MNPAFCVPISEKKKRPAVYFAKKEGVKIQKVQRNTLAGNLTFEEFRHADADKGEGTRRTQNDKRGKVKLEVGLTC